MPGRFVLALLALLIAVPATAAKHSPSGDSQPLMVIDLKTVSVDDKLVDPMNDLIEKLIVQHGGVVIEGSAIRRVMKKHHSKTTGSCRQDMECLGAVARELKAAGILTGSVAQVGDQFAVKLSLTDPASVDTPVGVLKMMSSLDSLSANVTSSLTTLFKWDAVPAAEPKATVTSKAAPEVIRTAPAVAAVLPAPEVTTSSASYRRVVVLDLQAISAPEASVTSLSSGLASELKHRGFDATSTADTKEAQAITAARNASGCEHDDRCLPEIARNLGTGLLVSGSVGQLGERYVVILALTDPKVKDSTIRAFDVAARLDDLPEAARRCLAKLFKWGPNGTADFRLPFDSRSKFALLDMTSVGLSEEQSREVPQALLVEVRGIEGTTILGQETVAPVLRAKAGSWSASCENAPCLQILGGALGVDHLIHGDAGKLGDTFVINLRLYDAHTGALEDSVTEGFEGDPEQTRRAVRHAVRQLIGLPETGKGNLNVVATANAADVYVDDDRQGATPAPVLNLAPGRHELRVVGNGYFDYRSDVYVDPAETNSVWAQLEPRPQPWYDKWWVWTIVGGVVVAAATTATIELVRPAPDTGHGTQIVP
jgi:TolB-like protein